MIPAAFGYSRPASLDEAFRILRERGDGAKVLAGGQSLLPLLKRDHKMSGVAVLHFCLLTFAF